MIVLRLVCSRCGEEVETDDETVRFCNKCGTLLNRVFMGTNRQKSTSKKGIFDYDVELATEIGKVLHEQFSTKTGYFEGHVMPEYIMPDIEPGSREMALYYTYVLAVDYQTDAHRLWRRSRTQYDAHPEMFEPEVILDTPDDQLRAFVQSIGARFPKNGAKAWKTISRILIDKYDGDPRNLTRNPITTKELERRLDQFPYIRGKKIGALFQRVMGDLGLLQISDLDKVDVAVDLQVSRFTFYTGVLKPIGNVSGSVQQPPIRPAIEGVWRQAANNIGIAPWKLDEPIWVIASNQCTGMICGPCPVRGLCERNFHIEVQGNQVICRKSGKGFLTS